MTPSPIDKTLDQVREDLYDRIQEIQKNSKDFPQHLNLKRGVVRGIIEVVAFGLFQLYQLLGFVLKQAFADTATGWFLDRHCKQVGISRNKISTTEGIVVFKRKNSTQNKPIPANTLLKTSPDHKGDVYQFKTIEEVVIEKGKTSITAKVIAMQPGSAYNVKSGQINEFTTPMPEFIVTNLTGWITKEGTDDETDEHLRNRYQLAWKAGSGISKYSYMNWAYQVPTVKEVFVLDNHPNGQGTIDIIVRGTDNVPSEETLKQVEKIIESHRPQIDNPKVKGVTVKPVSIRGKLILLSGDINTLPTQAEAAVMSLNDSDLNMENITPLNIGIGLTQNTLVAVTKTREIEKIVWEEIRVNSEALGSSVPEEITASAYELIEITNVTFSAEFKDYS